MERVSVIQGKKPVILVAPHGFRQDDELTAEIVENVAKNIKAYAVINRGWERADVVDCMNDKADCNNVVHCHEEVVKDEFLFPLVRYRTRILWHHPHVYIFYIHGMSDKHRSIVQDDLDMVVGYGSGSPDSHSCELWRKDLFIHHLLASGLNVYEGKKGGPMSGWARNNMNQLFRKWYYDSHVHSMQVEIVHELREDKDIAAAVSEYLSVAIDDLLLAKGFQANGKYKSY